MTQRRNKYNVNNTRPGKLERTVDGVLFASKAEATRYVVLKRRVQAGEIDALELQPRFEIIPAFADSGGHKHRATFYTADFRYNENGRAVVEEVKGHESRDFRLRMKLFLLQYPEYEYRLVKSGNVLKA